MNGWGGDDEGEHTDGFEDALVGLVGDAVLQWHVHRVPHAPTPAAVLEEASPREELAELMEGEGHDAVGDPEGLLYAVTVVAVYVNVEDTGDVLSGASRGCRGRCR